MFVLTEGRHDNNPANTRSRDMMDDIGEKKMSVKDF